MVCIAGGNQLVVIHRVIPGVEILVVFGPGPTDNDTPIQSGNQVLILCRRPPHDIAVGQQRSRLLGLRDNNVTADATHGHNLVLKLRQDRRGIRIGSIYDLARLQATPTLCLDGMVSFGVSLIRYTGDGGMGLQVDPGLDGLLQQGEDQLIRPEVTGRVAQTRLGALDVGQLFGLGRVPLIKDILHHVHACLPEEVRACLHLVMDGIRHERVHGPGQDKVTVDLLVLDHRLDRFEGLGLKGCAFGCDLDTMCQGQ